VRYFGNLKKIYTMMHGQKNIKNIYHCTSRPFKHYAILLVSNHTSERCILLQTYSNMLFLFITFYLKPLNTCLYKLQIA